MAGIPCIETIERVIGSFAGRMPIIGAGGTGVIMPASSAVHL